MTQRISDRARSQETVFVDVDDTLVMWDVSEYDRDEYEWFHTYFHDPEDPIALIRNDKNINLVKKLSKMGYKIVVWSQTGEEWARHISEAVGLAKYVDSYFTKPKFYVDDIDVKEWMGRRIWRAPDAKPRKLAEQDR